MTDLIRMKDIGRQSNHPGGGITAAGKSGSFFDSAVKITPAGGQSKGIPAGGSAGS